VAAIRELTPQLRAILQFLGEGHEIKAIAYQLGVTDRTVELHCGRLRKRLGVDTRTRLIALAGLGYDVSMRPRPQVNGSALPRGR